MNKYKVTITETLKMEVEVSARNIAEACEKVEANWNNSEYILDADHFKGADFTAELARKERDYER